MIILEVKGYNIIYESIILDKVRDELYDFMNTTVYIDYLNRANSMGLEFLNFSLTDLSAYLNSLGIDTVDISLSLENKNNKTKFIHSIIVHSNMRIIEYFNSLNLNPKSSYDSKYNPLDVNEFLILVDSMDYDLKEPVDMINATYIKYTIDFKKYHGLLYLAPNHDKDSYFMFYNWPFYLDKNLYLIPKASNMKIMLFLEVKTNEYLDMLMKLTESDKLFGLDYLLKLYITCEMLDSFLLNLSNLKRKRVGSEILLRITDAKFIDKYYERALNNYFKAYLL